MAIATSYPRIASFTYDFAVDGGATGMIMTGAFLPLNAIAYMGAAFVLTTLTNGGGNSPISIGTVSSASLFMLNEPFSNFTIGSVIEGTITPVSPSNQKRTIQSEITMTISTNPLTAGKFIYTLYYYVSSE